MKGKEMIAFAALDVGTSQVKLGVYCPSLSDKIIAIGSLPNSLVYGSGGAVEADYKSVRATSFRLFDKLGYFLQEHSIAVLHLGICGHVSSLLEWNKLKGQPVKEPFPIWLDRSCYSSINEYRSVMGEGKSKDIIGTFLPAGTNWLFTKLLHRRQRGFLDDHIFLQIGDALFYELTENYVTHFSSQISMVDLRKREYAPRLLTHLGLEPSALPHIESSRLALSAAAKNKFNFPDKSFVFPAMADLYTSLYGLQLQDNEGFMLANTSEQAGVFSGAKLPALDNFLSIVFNQGFVNYGSTNTGGNVVNWLFNSVLHKDLSTETFAALTEKASVLKPEETPLILPYLQGERAPLWNSKLTASVLELNASHTDVHLFRAVLESIAFARRQCFEQLGLDAIDIIKLGGGSSKNTLWNAIRASVINKPVAVAHEKELAMAGMIHYMLEEEGSSFEKPAGSFSLTAPDPDLVSVYEAKYQKFLYYQNLLSRSYNG